MRRSRAGAVQLRYQAAQPFLACRSAPWVLGCTCAEPCPFLSVLDVSCCPAAASLTHVQVPSVTYPFVHHTVPFPPRRPHTVSNVDLSIPDSRVETTVVVQFSLRSLCPNPGRSACQGGQSGSPTVTSLRRQPRKKRAARRLEVPRPARATKLRGRDSTRVCKGSSYVRRDIQSSCRERA